MVKGLVRFLLRFFFSQFLPSLFFILSETKDGRRLVEDNDDGGEKHPKDVEVGNKKDDKRDNSPEREKNGEEQQEQG